jgi:thiosulfate/3-mercaptopyruvate sulfurtransferase
MRNERTIDVLISTESLFSMLGQDNLCVVDSSFYLPGRGRFPAQEYLAQHIPGAIRFDIDAISDQTSSLPHMMPSPADFERHIRALGIKNDDHVVIYDSNPMFGCGRAWWMFSAFGHQRASVLDGGLPKWIREGRPVTNVPTRRDPSNFVARADKTLVVSIDQVVSAIDDNVQIVDARAAPRFAGLAPEPRPGLRLGHMPGAVNFPFSDMIDGTTGCMRSGEEIRELITATGIDPSKPVIVSCGSGVTACVVALGLRLIGANDIAVYDGSWAEWGSLPNTPIVAEPS